MAQVGHLERRASLVDEAPQPARDLAWAFAAVHQVPRPAGQDLVGPQGGIVVVRVGDQEQGDRGALGRPAARGLQDGQLDTPGVRQGIEDDGVESPVMAASREMLRERIENVLSTLTFREREIIKLRYGIGDGYTYTLEEVGRIFRVTRERVRQIEAKAVRKLQHPVRARRLSGFLDTSPEPG